MKNEAIFFLEGTKEEKKSIYAHLTRKFGKNNHVSINFNSPITQFNYKFNFPKELLLKDELVRLLIDEKIFIIMIKENFRYNKNKNLIKIKNQKMTRV